MLNVIFGLHSIVRWLAVLAAIAVVIKLVANLVSRNDLDSMTKGLLSAYSGMLDLNVLLGLIFFLWDGLRLGMLFDFSNPIIRHRWEHWPTLLIAVVLAHLPSRLWQDKPTNVRNRNSLIFVIISLLLIVVGVLALGMDRWRLYWPF